MKAINRAVIIVVCFYCLLLAVLIFSLQYQEQEQVKLYNIELNRCYQDIQKGVTPEELTAQPLKYVTEVQTLNADTFSGTDAEGFFSGYDSKTGNFRVYPIYREGELKSFVRFTYRKDRTVEQTLWWSACGIIIFSAAISLSLLLYIKRRVISPYLALNEQAEELTKGVFPDRIYNTGGHFQELSWKLGVLSKTLAQEKEARLNMERDRAVFLASLSHNIKTPLQTIHLYSQALTDGLLEDEGEEKNTAIKIAEKARQIDSIVKELISQSSAFDQNIEINVETLYLDKILTDLQERWRPELALRSIILEIRSYRNILVNGDHYRLTEVFDNILNNAVKYGDGKRIEIFVTEEDYHTAVHIKNTGQPCGEDELAFIFTSYWRGTNAKNKDGNGLGLFTCKKLMLLMDGDIYAVTHEDGFEVVLILDDAV